MNPEVWVASGHVGGFSDPLMDCKECKARFRADKIVEDHMTANGAEVASADGRTNEQLKEYIESNNIVCPKCGKMNYTDIRKFNLMFKTFQGVTEDAKSEMYLRPETAQGIFVNFKSVPGLQKNSNSICSNSLVLNVKLPGVISRSEQENLNKWN